MSRMILVTGGVRSGKSRFASGLLRREKNVVYIATMRSCDEETRERIRMHRESRPEAWVTAEEPFCPSAAVLPGEKDCQYILDCITMLVSNILLRESGGLSDLGVDICRRAHARAMEELGRLIEGVSHAGGTLVMVTNETGWSVVPENKAARVFRDVLGAVNRDIAARCTEVYLLACGCPLRLK